MTWLLSLLVTAAVAPPAEETDAAITVTGDRLDEQRARQRASDFVRAVGIAAGETPAARWLEPVCAKVAGLSAEHAASVAGAIRERACAVGAKIAPRNCRVNVAVVFSGDARKFARASATRSPAWLDGIDARTKTDLLEGVAPVRWWYTGEVRSRDGRRAATVLPSWTAGAANGGGSILPSNEDTATLVQADSSVVSTQVVRALTSATVVIDVNFAQGRALDAVAAYAGFVALAEMKAPRPPPSASILALFDAEGAPQDWTRSDRAFLAALYALPLDRQARQHRARLVGAIARELRPEAR